jgi:hypothetical protein
MQCVTDTFKDWLSNCQVTIDVFAQLEPLSTYTWVITDKFGRKYSAEFTTNSVGMWAIDVDDLPPGLLTQYGGDFVLEVEGANCKPVKFKVAQEYDRMLFTVKGGTHEKNQLGCEFTCTGISGVRSTIINYDIYDGTVVIPYTSEMLSDYGNAPTVQVYALVAGETDVYEIISAPVTHNYVAGVLTTITVSNLEGMEGYIILN